ncbi:MAG TPA: pantetheine-phosphate adenylyltransferase [Bacteroidales bacterium]|nr:pantetheine-phosphate adenylyltransferase [Bacteroidales bacterium]
MSKIAVFPGSFDPFTIGHESIVYRSLELFDKIVIAIGHNENKKAFFPLQVRMDMIKEVFKGESKIEVVHFEDLTVKLCQRVGAKYVLRGLRTSADFEYERAIAQVNKAMYPELESVFILTLPEHTSINSTIVREILKYGGDASKFVPASIDLKKYVQ